MEFLLYFSKLFLILSIVGISATIISNQYYISSLKTKPVQTYETTKEDEDCGKVYTCIKTF